MSQEIFTCTVEYATHEGGTKFYQVTYLQYGNRSVVATNWGPQKLSIPFHKDSPGARRATDLHAEPAAFAAQNIKDVKSRRGYTHWRTAYNSTGTGSRQLGIELEKLFSHNDAAAIMKHCVGEAPLESATPAAVIASQTDPEWGSW